MLKRILYAESGTGKTQEMLEVLRELPRISKSEITILHAVKPQITTEEEIAQREEGSLLLAGIANDLNRDRATPVSSLLLEGEPKDIVCQVAQSIDADLIILGSRGLRRLQAILLNSVSQYVFQLTDRSMLMVKDDVYVKKIKRVMVGLNESRGAQYALELTLDLLQDYPGCELILVRVNSDLKRNLPPLSKSEMEKDSILAPALARVKRMGISCRCLLTPGEPAKQISKLVEELNIDLLAIGSQERRPSVAKTLPDFDRLLGASVSDYLRVNANCPVLLARKEFT
ncbi:MAG: universal stress protein [Prochloraceae cyanobacterium]|nr:universal stress protein [Prochloraceae cyanobacterium]